MVGSAIAFLASRKEADARSDLSRAQTSTETIRQFEALIEALQDRVSNLETMLINERLERQRAEIEVKRLRTGINVLISQLIKMGTVPNWNPDEVDGNGETNGNG